MTPTTPLILLCMIYSSKSYSSYKQLRANNIVIHENILHSGTNAITTSEENIYHPLRSSENTTNNYLNTNNSNRRKVVEMNNVSYPVSEYISTLLSTPKTGGLKESGGGKDNSSCSLPRHELRLEMSQGDVQILILAPLLIGDKCNIVS